MSTGTNDRRSVRRIAAAAMEGAIKTFTTNLSGLRAGRASTDLLRPVTVEMHGTRSPLSRVASVSAAGPCLLVVDVWNPGMVASVEKAVRDAALGLEPSRHGQTVRVPVPPLSAERREEMIRQCGRLAEQTRVAVRNARRNAIEALRRQARAGTLEGGAARAGEKDIQALTDAAIVRIDDALKRKIAELAGI